MLNQSLTAKRIFLNAGLVFVALLLFAAGAFSRPQDPAERQKAIDLYESNNFTAALPLLEKVAADNPNDSVILSKLGFALYATTAAEKDPAVRQKLRDRAKATLLRARSLGDNSNLTTMVIDALSSPDPTEVPFSNIQAAEAAIREGEAAFVKGDLDKALAAYKRALESDPHLYDAALYAGDVEYKKASNSTDPQYRSDHFDASGTWFAKAIASTRTGKRPTGIGAMLWTRRAKPNRPVTNLLTPLSPSRTAAVRMLVSRSGAIGTK